MGLIQEKWNDEQCRFEDGIFFVNDEYIALTYNPDGSFQTGARLSVQGLIQNEPDGWANLDAACDYSNGEYIVIGGGGSYEGEGFIALLGSASRDLKWLLHLENIEVVTEIVIEEGVIIATAMEYPHYNTLTIPIAEPQSGSITCKHDV